MARPLAGAAAEDPRHTESRQPRLGSVITALSVLSAALIVLGVVVPADPPPAAPAPVRAAAPPAAPSSALTVVSRPSGRTGGWSPLGGSVVRGDLAVQLRGDLEQLSAVRYTLRAPTGEVSEADSRGAPFAAELPMRTAAAGSWRLEVRNPATSGRLLAAAGFTVAEGN